MIGFSEELCLSVSDTTTGWVLELRRSEDIISRLVVFEGDLVWKNLYWARFQSLLQIMLLLLLSWVGGFRCLVFSFFRMNSDNHFQLHQLLIPPVFGGNGRNGIKLARFCLELKKKESRHERLVRGNRGSQSFFFVTVGKVYCCSRKPLVS